MDTPPSPPSSGNSIPSSSLHDVGSKQPSSQNDPVKGSHKGHDVSVEDKVDTKLPKKPSQSRLSRAWKAIKDFASIKPTPPSYQYNAQVQAGGQKFQVLTDSPTLNIWTTDPKTQVLSNAPNKTVQHFHAHPYQGNPFQVAVPNLGVINLQPPPLFPQSAFTFPPIYSYQTVIQPLPQPAKPVYSHIYQDAAERMKISQSRVTDRFHMTEEQTGKLEKFANREFQRSFHNPASLESAVAKRKSSDFQFLGNVIKAHKENLSTPLPSNSTTLEERGKVYIHNIENGMRAIDTLLTTGSHYFPKDELEMIKDLRQQLNSERSLILQVMDQKGASATSEKLNWQAATDFKRVGYDVNTDTTRFMSDLTDKQCTKEEPFGAGLAHTVSKLTYKQGNETVDKIFKAEDSVDASPFHSVTSDKVYLDKRRPRFAARNLATQGLQKTLGLDLVPKTELTTHNGRVGILMDVAKGEKPYTQADGFSKEIPFDASKNPKVVAEIAKNLTSAEWLDCLCGQQDRNTGNYLIDPATGKVSLIDNDQAFYPGQSSINNTRVKTKVGSWVSPWPGPPALIDKTLLETLKATTEDSIEAQLTGLLEPKEIKSTISRFQQLKEHAEQLEKDGFVVENWETWKSPTAPPLTATEYLKLQGNKSAYFNQMPSAQTAQSVPGNRQTPPPTFSSAR